MTNLNLLGLPGSGKDIVKQALNSYLDKQQFKKLPIFTHNYQQGVNWLVIDVRSKLNNTKAEVFLKENAKISSLVIFCFAEESGLDVQVFWQKWVKENSPKLHILRLFHKSIKEDFIIEQHLKTSKTIAKQLQLQTVIFSPATLNLEHLMAGLDACKQNLQMDIWRIKGKILTTEYSNPVALEVTINRWDTFGCEHALGEIKISGKNLNKKFLQEVIDASLL